jgi:hypothetical protein
VCHPHTRIIVIDSGHLHAEQFSCVHLDVSDVTIDTTHLTCRQTGCQHLVIALHPNTVPIPQGDNVDGVPRQVLFAAATALNNNPLLPRLSTFDDDDPSPYPPSADCDVFGPLELELGTVEGLEIDDEVAAAFAPAASSTLFKNGLGKFSSSAKSYPGEGWLLGAGIGSALAAAARLELLPDGRKCGCGSSFPDYARWKSTRHCH